LQVCKLVYRFWELKDKVDIATQLLSIHYKVETDCLKWRSGLSICLSTSKLLNSFIYILVWETSKESYWNSNFEPYWFIIMPNLHFHRFYYNSAQNISTKWCWAVSVFSHTDP
jgi:hypothetical protein